MGSKAADSGFKAKVNRDMLELPEIFQTQEETFFPNLVIGDET